MLHGPNGNYVPNPTGVKLIDDAKAARLLWTSEEKDVPVGKLASSSNPYAPRLSGGTASLIVADGKVFAAYFQVSGTGVDDILLAIDQTSGKTLWKSIAGKGVDNPPSKRGGFGVTPAYASGKVFWLGSGGRLFALDATTGKVLWETPVLAISGADAPDMLCAVVVADGVVVAPTFKRQGANIGLAGFDPASGMKLWEVGPITAWRATPAIFRGDDGREYLLTGTEAATATGAMTLLDAKTGKTLWTVGGLGSFGWTLTPSRTHVGPRPQDPRRA